MEREAAEVMDPREDRTSAIRTRLNNMLSNRMQGLPATDPSPKSNVPTSQTPLPSINEPPKGTSAGESSLPQLPPLGFDSSSVMRRTLTPIVEASPAQRNPALPVVPGVPTANPPQQSDGLAPPSNELRNEDQIPTSTSPAPPPSPPSAYAPTDPASTPLSPTRGPSEESARNDSVPKPVPETGISVNVGVSSGLPSNDDGPAASTTSLQSSAASPPPLSPANSSNPPASSSPGLLLPRTPSPKYSVLTSPHSMMDSPTRAMGQTIAEFGSSTERLSQSSTPSTPLRAATVTVAPSKLPESIQESTPSSRDGTMDIYDAAGAMFYLHHLNQGPLEVDSRPLPDTNGKDVSSESEGVGGRFIHHAQPTVAPLRTRGTSPPPRKPTGTHPLSVDIVQHRKPPNQQLPRTPTLEYGPERRPFGARAAPVNHRQDTLTSSTHSPRNLSIRGSTGNPNMPHGNTTHLEDPDADALAALSFLERHDDVPPAAPAPSSPTTIRPTVASSPTEPRPPTIIEPDVRSPSPDSEVYKSSFAPSKNAMQRKARSEAQQAAHEAAAHRPGRGTGKTKSKSKAGGGWEDSSDEEEEEEEEEEDVDSDGQPVASRDDRSMSNYAASANNHRSQYSSPRGPSPLASGDASSYQPQPHTRPPRNLPPVPLSRAQGLSLPS
jgi:CCR4-NOT transcriptional complex subunit CAF120